MSLFPILRSKLNVYPEIPLNSGSMVLQSIPLRKYSIKNWKTIIVLKLISMLSLSTNMVLTSRRAIPDLGMIYLLVSIPMPVMILPCIFVVFQAMLIFLWKKPSLLFITNTMSIPTIDIIIMLDDITSIWENCVPWLRRSRANRFLRPLKII